MGLFHKGIRQIIAKLEKSGATRDTSKMILAIFKGLPTDEELVQLFFFKGEVRDNPMRAKLDLARRSLNEALISINFNLSYPKSEHKKSISYIISQLFIVEGKLLGLISGLNKLVAIANSFKKRFRREK